MQVHPIMRRTMLALCAAALLASTGGAVAAQSKGTEELTFRKPTAAVINARRWDETQQQWLAKPEKQGTLFFDALHRYLFLRFPGCATAIHEKLANGYEVASAKLHLRWVDQEFVSVAGYRHRGWQFLKMKPPQWHAKAFLLRQPWIADEKLGPTWNAYINGAGYWRGGGAAQERLDRFPTALGKAPLSKEHPIGQIDVTTALCSADYGATVSERLSTLESCGFLVRKDELVGAGERFTPHPLGNARIWIADPKLVVTFKPVSKTAQSKPPVVVDVRALAAKLKATGGDGLPTSVVPENLEALLAARRARPTGMPDWMQRRVQELVPLKTQWDGFRSVYSRLNDPAAADRETYLEGIDWLLSRPPGWDRGHSNVDPIITLLDAGHLLPDVARRQLRLNMQARWTRPFREDVFVQSVGYFGSMATLNHQSQCRAEALLAGETLGWADLTVHAQRNVSLMNRQMIFVGGVNQEHGGTFYQSISLTNLKTVARYSVSPLYRLKADLGVEKMILENNATYHPGLRRRVAPVGRRYELHRLLMGQDVPRAVLHTLSKKGVLIETDKESVNGLPVLCFSATSPKRVVNLAPWGAEWEVNTVDNKPIPFTFKGTHASRGLLMDDPIHYVTSMGDTYALSGSEIDLVQEWPVVVAWRRSQRTVEKFTDLGIMFPWAYMNGSHVNLRAHKEETKGVKGTPMMATLIHRNKMLYVIRPPERFVAEPFCKDGVTSFWSRLSIYAFGPDDRRQIFIDGEPVTSFPVTAKQGQVITIREGATYVGLIPLEATDLGRSQEVRISYTHPRLNLDSYVLDTDKGLPNTDATWQRLIDATAGWVIEMGCHKESGSFEAFRQHMAKAKPKTDWQAKEGILHVAYTSGDDTLELGFMPRALRKTLNFAIPPSRVIAYQRINGQAPFQPGITLDCPLGQLGKTAELTKGGAVLRTVPGQVAMLRVEPLSGTYVAVNPFVDPTPLELTTPEGVVIRSEGPLGCGRITVCPKTNTLSVDYQLPPPEGDLGLELLQADAKKGLHGGPKEWEAPLSQFFRADYDVANARKDSARALLVTGTKGAPTIILNGKPLADPVATLTRAGTTWYRIPMAPID